MTNETLTAAARAAYAAWSAAYAAWTAARDHHKALSRVGSGATRAQLTASFEAREVARAALRAADDARLATGAPE